MSRMFERLNRWLTSGQQIGGETRRGRRSLLSLKAAQRRRTRKQPLIEAMEDRVVLSSPHVALPEGVAHISAELARVKKTATHLAASAVSGVKGGTVTLTASLTSAGLALPGKNIRFQIRGRSVGKAVTNAQGIAVLANVKLKGTNAGNYLSGVVATYAGSGKYKQSSSRSALAVSRFASSVSDVAASGVYAGEVAFTATLKSNGAPVQGQIIHFAYNGNSVGQASTNAQGVATLGHVVLPGINAGVHANAVTAVYAGTLNFGQNSGGGNLTLSQAQANLSLGGLSQTYDGTAKAATVVTAPPGLTPALSYKDATGNPVASPTAAGSYTVSATIADPNYTGSATGTLNIAKAQLTVSGITASNKTYDGTAAAAIDTTGATLAGVVSGDSVTLDSSGAAGVFDTKNVGTGKTVTINGLTLSGSAAANYTVVAPTTTANISAAILTVTGITASNKGYNGTTTATLNSSAAALSGVVNGDVVTLNTAGATGTFDTPAIGTGKTVTIAGLLLSGADAGNYSLGQTTTTADITLGTLTVTGITAANKVYDGSADVTLGTSGIALSGVVNGDDVSLLDSGITGSFDTKNAGTGKTVTISGLTLTGADAGKYMLDEPTLTADITPAPLSVTGITASDKIYDGAAAAALDTTGATLSARSTAMMSRSTRAEPSALLPTRMSARPRP